MNKTQPTKPAQEQTSKTDASNSGAELIDFPALEEVLQSLKAVGVLVSGGCDSEVLLRAATKVLKKRNAIAFTAVTPFITEYYLSILEALAEELGVTLIKTKIDPLAVPKITENNTDRCYHCKTAIYSAIKTAAAELGVHTIIDGTNMDDTNEYRPGLKAAEELGVKHPFVTAGMTKAAVRTLGKQLHMQDPDRPSDSCLATRIPEGTTITDKELSLIARIEKPLKAVIKGRLRAKVSKRIIELQFESVDRVLVENRLEQLERIADKALYSLVLKEMQ